MGDTDIDSFIRQQKSKLANERQNMNNQTLNGMSMEEYRRKWRQVHDVDGRRSPDVLNLRPLNLAPNGLSSPFEHDQDWYYDQDPYMEARPGQRRQWDTSGPKLSPRGELDTEHLVTQMLDQKEKVYDRHMKELKHQQQDRTQPGRPLHLKLDGGHADFRSEPEYVSPRVDRRAEEEEYRQKWRRLHPEANDPRRNMPREGRLDLDSLLDKRVKEIEIEEEERRRGGGDRGGNNDYRKKWEQNKLEQRGYKGNKSLREQTDEYKANATAPNASDNDKLAKMQQRNNEYNEFLAQKALKEKHRFDSRKPPPEVQRDNQDNFATIPGLRYSNSAQRREMQEERNREYNEMLNNKRGRPTVRQGWGTPTYQEVLDKKRAEESQYRRAIEGYTADAGIRANYKDAVTAPTSKDYGHSRNNKAQYYGTLPIGRDSDSAKIRAKEEYKQDLQKQMAEEAQRRKQNRGGVGGAPLNLGGNTPRKTFDHTHPAPYHTTILEDLKKLEESPRNNMLLHNRQDTFDRRNQNVVGLHLGAQRKFGGEVGGVRSTSRLEDNGLRLEFDHLLSQNNRVASLEPPASLVYQPSTYITANAVPNLNNSMDEAYNFYGSRNPLDPNLGTAVPARDDGPGVPSLNLAGVGGEGGPSSRVRFKDPKSQARKTPAIGMDFGTDEDRKRDQRSTQDEYRDELRRQMEEKNRRKMLEKEAQEKYDLKMEEEARNYDPFGKGGGGAPMRDPQGNVISDLRQMRNDNIQVSGREPPPKVTFSPRFVGSGLGGFADSDHHAGNTTVVANSYRDDLIGPPPTQTTAEGEASFARGGHGIFGMPKTDVEKMQADKYKLELKKQMEEKKAEQERKRQLQKQEDEREQKILDEQRARMQREYDEEQKKIKEKEEEARKKNEEMMRLAEERKREIENKRREAEERRLQEQREEREMERQMRERQEVASPPIPAARTRTAEPPIEPAYRKQEPPQQRAQSADVLNQLAAMRAQLQNERKRVQTMLDDQENDVEIYDPRQVQRPPPGPVIQGKPDVDVFETAVNRNPVAVRRTPGDRASAQAVEDFNALKHKNNSDSRKQFRQMFPSDPSTNDALEAQQDAMLRQQEERLRNIRDRKALGDTSALQLGRDTYSSSSQLHSNSAFVDVNGISDFPDDFEDIPRRNDSARYRRRARAPTSPRIDRLATPDFNSRNTFGSQTSLNVDKLARKNEDRLRRLRELQGDDISLYDPDDVLDRFMSKQGHNRPPSRNTLLDDTWMRAGSKQSKY